MTQINNTIRPWRPVWHAGEMPYRILVTTSLLLLLFPLWAWPDLATIRFRVVSEDGAALPNAQVSSGEQHVAVNRDGRVVLGVSDDGPHLIRVSAPDHYTMTHSFVATAQSVADIQLVKKKNGRRLLLFAGDAMLSRRFFEPRAGEPVLVRRASVFEDGKNILRFVKSYVELADVASVNLETQLTSGPLTDPLPKSVTFYSPAELAPLLEWAGFDYVALGNNHTFDYRDAGIRSTMQALENTSLGHSGAGFNERQAREAYTTELGGRPISFLSYVGWPGGFTPTQTASGDKGGAALGNGRVFAADAGKLDANAIAVLQHHSGIEYAERPAMTERTNLRTAIDAGVDVAIGHHSHVLQGLEIYKDRLIAYSMGNFLFDQYIYSTQAGMLLYVWMDGDTLHRAEIVPLNINGYVPTPATGAFRYAVLNRLARLSQGFGTCLNESGAHAILGDGIECETAKLPTVDADSTTMPISLFASGVSPVNAIEISTEQKQHRFGVDLLPRGNFESAGQYGVPVRAWLTGQQAQVVAASDQGQELQVNLSNKQRVRTGMKVFERAFRVSSPSTVSGRIRADGGVSVRFLLQRRRTDQGLTDALVDGPLTEIGGLSLEPGKWHEFALDHQLPRTTTKSIRLLIELDSELADDRPVEVQLDDLAWVEWHTPWMRPDKGAGQYATHVQSRRP